jgi:hypothetical protein
MPAVTDGNLGTSTLAPDRHHVESLLAELASELRRVPVDELTSPLHLRALSLKRAVMHWRDECPDESVRRAVFDEVRALHGEARDWRRLSRLGGRSAAGEVRGGD